MNKEIKEILINNIKNEIKKTKEEDFSLCIEQWKQLLDYITNLQEESNKLKDTMAKIKDLNTMQYLRDDIFKDQLSYILEGEDNEDI